MKKVLKILTLALVAILLVSLIVNAHSGGTDSNGGHFNHSNGTYHYHHGLSAHDHPNDICPYSSTAKATNQSHENTYTIPVVISAVCLLAVVAVVIFLHKRNSPDNKQLHEKEVKKMKKNYKRKEEQL